MSRSAVRVEYMGIERTVEVQPGCEDAGGLPGGSSQPSAESFWGLLEFESLIADTSAALFAASLDQTAQTVQVALERLRVFFQVDRCVLLSVTADQQNALIRLASYAEAVPSVPAEINLGQVFPWSRRTLLVERRPVRISRRTELPPEEHAERQAWRVLPIQAALTLPIESGGVVSHLILLNTLHREHEWPEALVTRLRVFGQMLVSALKRQETEERASLAVDSAEAGLWALDCRAGVFWATERTRRMFGFLPDELINMDRFQASLHPGDRDHIRRALQQAEDDPLPFEVEYRIVMSDGQLRWVSSRGQPHFTATGALDRITGASIDITGRKQAEEALRVSQKRLESGADLAGLAFYEVDFDKAAVYVDDRMRSLCGLPSGPDQDLRFFQFWMDHLHPDDRPRIMDERQRLHQGSTDRVSVEYRYLHPSGRQMWLDHLARVAERDSTGRVIRVFGVVRDITARRQAEEALRQSLAEIEQLKDRLQAEGEYLKAEIRVTQAYGVVTGQSAAIRRVLHMVEQVAPADSSVLVRGETGTGKELIAQAIHRLSHRRDHVMVKVNCAALPSGLVESELFGREKGAFTGAMTRQIGRFEIADGSTLFLDEIGELPLDLQAKLLRVLESGEFERLGSSKTIKVNVRLIAATNRDLTEAIRQGKFREDLFYRLNVFPIVVPPLRDRADDIPQLVWAFLGEFSSRMGKKITQVPRKTMDALQRHRWPGNVRELRNVIEHGAIITTGDTLKIPMLDEARPAAAPGQTLADGERNLILRALERAGWHIKGPKGAAAELGINPGTLYGRMKKLGIRPPGEVEDEPV